jgi:hypothetical protein
MGRERGRNGVEIRVTTEGWRMRGVTLFRRVGQDCFTKETVDCYLPLRITKTIILKSTHKTLPFSSF